MEIKQIKRGDFSVLTDGEKIVKIMYHGNDKKIYGLARCNLKEDKFDFEYGYELALDRALYKVYKNLDNDFECMRKKIVHKITIRQGNLTRKLKKRGLL